MDILDINCDLGEGFDNEEELMPYIQSCNIACGAHAGNKKSMRKMVAMAIKHEVKIGAHPSYPDKVNFGRKRMNMKTKLLMKSIQDQIHGLKTIIDEFGGTLHHIKAHGALYNDIMINDELSLFFLRSIGNYMSTVKLYVPFGSFVEKNALRNDFSIVYEAFADRNYNNDLSLVSRDHPEALISDPELIANRVLKIINKKKVTSISGKEVSIRASTFCIHSDSPNAVSMVKKIYNFRKEQLLF